MSLTVREDCVVQDAIGGGIPGYELNVMTDVSLRHTHPVLTLCQYISVGREEIQGGWNVFPLFLPTVVSGL